MRFHKGTCRICNQNCTAQNIGIVYKRMCLFTKKWFAKQMHVPSKHTNCCHHLFGWSVHLVHQEIASLGDHDDEMVCNHQLAHPHICAHHLASSTPTQMLHQMPAIVTKSSYNNNSWLLSFQPFHFLFIVTAQHFDTCRHIHKQNLKLLESGTQLAVMNDNNWRGDELCCIY